MNNISLLHYRLEAYNLTNASKEAGFVFYVPTQTLSMLSKIKVSEQHVMQLKKMCDSRLNNLYKAGMIRKGRLKSAHISLWHDSATPRFFTEDPAFGGSLGADPQMFESLNSQEAAARVGDEAAYTPHNVDGAVSALILTVLVATWAEWAQDFLYLASYSK